MLAVDRDVKPRNMNFAKVEKRGGGGGGAINREGAFIAINTVFTVFCLNMLVTYSWVSYNIVKLQTCISFPS